MKIYQATAKRTERDDNCFPEHDLYLFGIKDTDSIRVRFLWVTTKQRGVISESKWRNETLVWEDE